MTFGNLEEEMPIGNYIEITVILWQMGEERINSLRDWIFYIKLERHKTSMFFRRIMRKNSIYQSNNEYTGENDPSDVCLL